VSTCEEVAFQITVASALWRMVASALFSIRQNAIRIRFKKFEQQNSAYNMKYVISAYLSLFNTSGAVEANVQISVVVEKPFQDIQHFGHLCEYQHPSGETNENSFNFGVNFTAPEGSNL
jgi:hypothetical protein